MMAIVMFKLSVTISEMFAVSVCMTSTWPCEWAKVKCKYDNWKPKYDFLIDDNISIVCYIFHYLQDIPKWSKMPSLNLKM